MNHSVETSLVALAFVLPAAGVDAPERLHWDGITEIATGRGDKGPWQQNESRYDYVDDATVAFDAGGGLCVAWVDQKRKDVFFQHVSPVDDRPRGTPVNVSRSPATFSWLARIATSPSDPARIYLLWQEIIFAGGSHGGDILLARSSDGGASFSPPLNLSHSRGGDGKGRLNRETWSNGSLDLAIGGDGAVLAAWTEYQGTLWFARSADGGASFSQPRKVAGEDARPARAPSLAAGPGRIVYLAWTVGEDPTADIRVAQSGDGGASFGAPQLVDAGPGHADAPGLAVDGSGAVHLVYSESPSGPNGRHEIRYARSPSGAGKFGAARTISSPVTNGTDGAGYPSIATDGRKGLFVTWEIFPASAGRSQSLGITYSSDAGQHFARPATVPGSGDPFGGSNGSQQGLLGKKLAVDRSARLAVVNSSLVPGERSRVWLMRGHAVRPGTAPGAQKH
jgi:hypothetical protein